MKAMFATLLCATLLVVSACGWQLRGYQQFKLQDGEQRIESLQLSSTSEYRLLMASLNRQIEDLGITVKASAPLSVSIQNESTERRPLSYGSTGIPVQYQLIMIVNFVISDGTENAFQPRMLTARRQYDFDPELVVAKSEEEQQLLQEMRNELASRIISLILQ